MANVLNRVTMQYLDSVHTPNYPVKDWIKNPVLPACDKKYWKISGDLVQEMSAAEKKIVDDEYLAVCKNKKYLQVKTNTDKLIQSGFIFNGILFGSELSDQSNWNTVLCLKDKLSYPLSGVVKDRAGNYVEIANKETIENIVLTGMATVNAYRASHKVLVDQIKDCTSIAELNAIVDTRS
jgi:hypothetical protein